MAVGGLAVTVLLPGGRAAAGLGEGRSSAAASCRVTLKLSAQFFSAGTGRRPPLGEVRAGFPVSGGTGGEDTPVDDWEGG